LQVRQTLVGRSRFFSIFITFEYERSPRLDLSDV
jgi:hypothetical protein